MERRKFVAGLAGLAAVMYLKSELVESAVNANKKIFIAFLEVNFGNQTLTYQQFLSERKKWCHPDKVEELLAEDLASGEILAYKNFFSEGSNFWVGAFASEKSFKGWVNKLVSTQDAINDDYLISKGYYRKSYYLNYSLNNENLFDIDDLKLNEIYTNKSAHSLVPVNLRTLYTA